MDAFSDPTIVAEQEMVEQDRNLELALQRVRISWSLESGHSFSKVLWN